MTRLRDYGETGFDTGLRAIAATIVVVIHAVRQAICAYWRHGSEGEQMTKVIKMGFVDPNRC